MGGSEDESVGLLRRLLSSAKISPQPKTSGADDIRLLRQLVSLAPIDRAATNVAPLKLRRDDRDNLTLLDRLLKFALPEALPRRPTTLFDAMKVRHLENPHSDFIAWLLDPRGPLSDMWLAKSLYEFVGADDPWPGVPSVDREVACDDGRADILMEWKSGFKIVIENKVRSSEGEDQIKKYLDGFGIAEPRDGRVIYLTPDGIESTSKGEDANDRVVEMSYGALAELVARGMGTEENPRGKIFAGEFIDCIGKLLRRRNLMERVEKKGFSESSQLYMLNVGKIESIRERAAEECAAFLEWMGAEAERRLSAILGSEMRCITSEGGWIFAFMPSWIIGETRYGIMYCTDYSMRGKTFGDDPDGHWVGV